LYLMVVAVIWRVERQPPPLGEAAELTGDDSEDGRAPAVALALVLAGIALAGVLLLAAYAAYLVLTLRRP
jgi:hypothetical protein